MPRLTKLKISVLISNYNRAHFLKDSLYLIGHQTMNQKEYEVIVVDDGSTDNTDQVIEEAKGWIENLHYVKRSRWKREIYNLSNNCAITRNISGKLAKAPILLHTDPEVMPMPDWVENHWKAHQVGNKIPRHNDSAIVIEPDKYYAMIGLCLQFFHFNIISDDCRGAFFGRLEDWDFRDIEYVWEALNSKIRDVEKQYGIPLSYPNMREFYIFQQTQAGMSFRKDLFLKLGGYDEIFCSTELDAWAGEDTLFNYYLDRNNVMRVENPSCRAIHLYHPKRTEGYKNVEFAHKFAKEYPDKKVANEGREWGILDHPSGRRWEVVF